MKIETVNRDALLRAFTALKYHGVTKINIDTVTDIIEMFPIIMYDPEDNKDERL